MATARTLEAQKDYRAAAAYGRAVAITPEMVHAVVQALRKLGRACVVMLSDADGEAAHLFATKKIDLLFTEDSDALLNGCENVSLFFYILLSIICNILFFRFVSRWIGMASAFSSSWTKCW
jgi:5'-3' exonuclease